MKENGHFKLVLFLDIGPQWMLLDGDDDGVSEYYYFNERGYLLTAVMTPDRYEVNGNGAWIMDGKVQTVGTKKVQKKTYRENIVMLQNQTTLDPMQ